MDLTYCQRKNHNLEPVHKNIEDNKPVFAAFCRSCNNWRYSHPTQIIYVYGDGHIEVIPNR